MFNSNQASGGETEEYSKKSDKEKLNKILIFNNYKLNIEFIMSTFANCPIIYSVRSL